MGLNVDFGLRQVVRPDSGVPKDMVLAVLESLAKNFPPAVRACRGGY